MSAPRPPRLARRLLRRLLPVGDREYALGDLDEEFARRAGADSPAAARRWYRRQAARALLHRINEARPGRRHAGAAAGFLLATGRDLRHALRGLRAAPGFALVSVATLALGIGASTAVYTLFDHLVLRPLPFEKPERLVVVQSGYDDVRPARWPLSFPDYLDYRSGTEAFAALAAWRAETPAFTLPGSDAPAVRIHALAVTAGLLPMLGVRPRLGRTITAEDDSVEAPARVALLSHHFWTAQFGADPGAPGREFLLDGTRYTVIGVLPEGFTGAIGSPVLPPVPTDVWVPFRTSFAADGMEVRSLTNVNVVGRLAEGAGVERADQELAAVSASLQERFPELREGERVYATAAGEAASADLRDPLALLFGAVALVLLISCVNVANLLLARGTARRRELAVRHALGASRARLVRQHLAESLVLGSLGGLSGAALAWLLVRVLPGFDVVTLTLSRPLSLDGRVLLFTVVVSLGSALLFGLAPVLQAGRPTLRPGLGDARRSTGGGERARGFLVTAELGLAVTLLVTAVLVLSSLLAVLDVDPGFEPDGVLVARLQLPMEFVDPDWPEAVRFFRELEERLAGLPGVTAAAAAYQLPTDPGWNNSFQFTGESRDDQPFARFRPVTPGYFRTAGIRLVAGRRLRPTDDSDSEAVAVVNRAFVRRWLPDGEDPVGKSLDYSNWWGAAPDRVEIVGVVEDVRFSGRSREVFPATYFPHAQQPVREMWMLLRVDGDPLALAPGLRQEVARLDPRLPVDGLGTLEERLAATEASARAVAQLLAGFALVALTLAAVGVYGLMRYAVSRRTRELGIRMALGARRGDVLRLVLRRGAALTAAGAAIGAGGAFLASRLLAGELHRAGSGGPLAFAVALGILIPGALLACWLPARRATRVDPARSLRAE